MIIQIHNSLVNERKELNRKNGLKNRFNKPLEEFLIHDWVEFSQIRPPIRLLEPGDIPKRKMMR